MPVVTIRCLLKIAADCEQRLDSFLAQLRDGSPDNNVRLLAYYLSRRRYRLSGLADDCQHDLLNSIIDHEIKLPSLFPPAEVTTVLSTPADLVRGAELLLAWRKYSLDLLSIYHIIQKDLETPALRAALLNLKKAEKHDVSMLEKLQAIHYF